nr:hypothetical protein [Streptomyces megasporus]
MAIALPLVVLATLAVVQASLFYLGREIALTAAREGVAAGRTWQAGPEQGAQRARAVLDRTAGDLLRSPAVSTAGSTGTRVRISVTGTVVSVLPGVGDLHITQSASGPVERWTQAPRGD